jgi:hypothetical protein
MNDKEYIIDVQFEEMEEEDLKPNLDYYPIENPIENHENGTLLKQEPPRDLLAESDNLFQILKNMFKETYKRDLTPAEEVKLRVMYDKQLKAVQSAKPAKITEEQLEVLKTPFKGDQVDEPSKTELQLAQDDYEECEKSYEKLNATIRKGLLHPSEVEMPSRESVELFYQKYGTKDNPYPTFVCKTIEVETNAVQDSCEKHCEQQYKIAESRFLKKDEE